MARLHSMIDPDSKADDLTGYEQHLLDPRRGDIEDDTSSPKSRSLLAIAGTLLAEVSIPKLLFAWTISLLLPAVLLGLAPLVATAWFASLSSRILYLAEIGTALVLLVVVGIGFFAWRPLLRIAEENFWSLHALLVLPTYMLGSEAIRHLIERLFGRNSTDLKRVKLRAASSAISGLMMCLGGLLIAGLVWPSSRWLGTASDIMVPHHLIVPTIANAVVLVSVYFAISSFISGFFDASMEQPHDLRSFDVASHDRKAWRVAHLTDIHAVGERYGFRIESGRGGPRGNDRFCRLLSSLADIHAARPLDLLLVTGDATDAGRSTEWAEFFDAINRFPDLAARMIVLPGNHDLNIASRSNPAQIDLPFSIRKLLRQARTLSAINAVQGDRVYVISDDGEQQPLRHAMTLQHQCMTQLAEQGDIHSSIQFRKTFHSLFPMIAPPSEPNGLGIAILNSNAESHFSFTNALGFVSIEQANRLLAAFKQYPDANWIVALHHHLQEYPKSGPFSIRIGTALVNGSWFIRKLRPYASRAIIFHGHRHMDWIGTCGSLKVVSGPSPVMGAVDSASTHFYIHTLTTNSNGHIALLPPERVNIAGSISD